MRLEGKRVAVYARYSTDKQNPRSVADQVRACTEYVQREGGSVADVFADEATSGKIGTRPGIDALKEAVRAGRVHVVVCEDLSRLGRDLEHLHGTLKRFRSWGARLIAINDGIDDGGSGAKSAKMLGGLKALMGDLAVDEIRDRTIRGLQSALDAGKSTGGRAYGYRSHDGVRCIDEREAETVRRVFALWCSGEPLHAIARKLNRDGVPSARGGKWSHGAVRAMLRNEQYVGIVVWNRKQWALDIESERRRYTTRSRAEWRKREQPELRIIDAATWAEAQARVRSTAQTYAQGKRPKRGYPLSGLLVCGACGEPMTVAGRYYACSGRKKGHGCENLHSLSEPGARAWLLGAIIDAIGADDVLDGLRSQLAATIGQGDRDVRAELADRRATLARTEGKARKLLDLLLDGDTPTRRAALAEAEDHAELQRAAIYALERQLDTVPVLPSRDEMRGFLAALPALAAGRPDAAREVLGSLLVAPAVCTPPARRGEPYALTAELRPCELLAHAVSARGTAYASGGCGGAIRPLAQASIRVSGLVALR